MHNTTQNDNSKSKQAKAQSKNTKINTKKSQALRMKTVKQTDTLDDDVITETKHRSPAGEQ